jgi:GLPGLI family protein
MNKNMRILLSLALCVFLQYYSFAQNNQGEIVYEEKVNIHMQLPMEMEGMKENIPEFRTTNYILLFNANESIYKPKEKTEQEKEAEQAYRERGRRGNWMMRMGRGRGVNSVYTNIAEGSTLASTDLFGKMFLVNGQTKSYNWKVTGKQKQVGSYLCMEAIHTDTTETIEVWFTPMIPVQSGPGDYASLPGLVLHVDINEGEKLITAQNIDLRSLEEEELVKPTEGKAISQEEFDKLRKEKMEEMKAEQGGRRRFHHD